MLDFEALLRSDQLFDGHYKLIRTLSTDGATADVWLALDMNTIDQNAQENDESSGMLVAIKIYRPKNALDQEGEQRFRDEYKIAHECRHVNLLPPEGFSIFQGMPYLILPYCEAGSAEQLIGKNQTNDEIWKFIADVAAGIDRLHNNKPQIIHQDIKPANILIDNNGNYTITDFGISSRSSGPANSYYDEYNSGTLAYMAPERFGDDLKPMAESDIWAFGATLCEILTGQMPFGEDGGLKQKNDKQATDVLNDVPTPFKSLIRDCLNLNPDKRPTARKIMDIARAKRYPTNGKRTLLLVFISLIAIAGVVFFLLHSPKKGKEIKAPTITYNLDEVTVMLNDSSTCHKGLLLLDSLVNTKDAKATYLKSRLYFNASDSRDKVFHDASWETIQRWGGIEPNNEKAHQLLFQSFKMNEDDYATLFQLGKDYHALNYRRGCEQNIPYALWCYQHAEEIAEKANTTDAIEHLSKIRDQINNIIGYDDDTTLNPQKPAQP